MKKHHTPLTVHPEAEQEETQKKNRNPILIVLPT